MKTVQSIPRPSLARVDKSLLSQALQTTSIHSFPESRAFVTRLECSPAVMPLVLCVVAVLFGCPLGEMFVLHPSPEASAVKANRCKGELEIRKILLESLNLQQEPRVSMSKMHHLREQWKASFRSSLTSAPAGNATFPEDSRNSSCCKHFCQIFIKDLGWEHWVVYPESITFVKCQSCASESTDAPAQCCLPTAHVLVPFVYMDDWSGVVLSSVSLIRECGCDPGEETQNPEVMTPS